MVSVYVRFFLCPVPNYQAGNLVLVALGSCSYYPGPALSVFVEGERLALPILTKQLVGSLSGV